MKIFKKLFYILKFYTLLNLKQRNKCDAIDNYADQIVLQAKLENQGIQLPKKIWIYWEGSMPTLVRHCIDHIQKLHPDYTVNLLNPNNVADFISFDLTSPILQKATSQQRADLIRFDLIYHYGGIWLDASIIVYKKLDWIEKLIQQTKTQGFAYYRKKNTTLADFPVIENWLLASVEKNPFYQLWFDELFKAIDIGPKQYIQYIQATYDNSQDYFQHIGRLEYLVAYVACQKVMRDISPSMVLINCDENAFFYQVKNKWVKEKTLIDLAICEAPEEYPNLIKLAGKERKILDRHFTRGQYFENSLLDF